MENIVNIYELKMMSATDRIRIMQRAQEEIDEIYPQVQKIIDDVRQRGDEALFEYMEQFDNVKLDATTVKVDKEEIKEAYQKIDKTLLESLKVLHKQVQRFHDLQHRGCKALFIHPELAFGVLDAAQVEDDTDWVQHDIRVVERGLQHVFRWM